MPGNVDDTSKVEPSEPTEADVRRLAYLLARAESAVRTRQASRSAGVAGSYVLVALGLAVIGLLLPWSSHDGITRDGFTYAAALPTLTLVTVAAAGILLAQCFANPDERWVAALRRVVATGASASVLVGLVVLGQVEKNEHQWWGPALFHAALVAAIALAYRPEPVGRVDVRLLRSVHEPSLDSARDRVRESLQAHLPGHGRQRWRVPLAALGVSGLAVSGAALTATWEQLSGAVIDQLEDNPLVWRGTELAGTLALRWVVAAGLALSLAAAVLPRTRRLLPLVLGGAGAAVTILTVLRVADIPIRGTNASIGVGIGAWTTLAAGLVATLSGVALFVVSRPKAAQRSALTPAVGVVALALLVLPLVSLTGVGESARAVAGPDVRRVLPPSSAADGSRGLGEPLDKASFARLSSSGTGADLPNVAGSLDNEGGTWFIDDVPGADRYRDYVVKEIVHGRVLPVTMITGADHVQLLAVGDDHALVLANSTFGNDFVSLIDLHEGLSSADGSARGGSNRGESTAVLTAVSYPSRTPMPGEVVAKSLAAVVLADGSVVLTVRSADGETKTYRVDAATVRGSAPWRLGAPLPPASVRAAYGPDGASYETGSGTIIRTGSDTVPRPVLGKVSDARCTLSRDPLSSSLAEHRPDPDKVVLDRSGNLWTVLEGAARLSKSVLYVVTKDGVLRRPADARWTDVRGLQIASDGALYITSRSRHRFGVGSTYRIADPDALARAAETLPPVPGDCVSDNRVKVSTAGRHATSVATVSKDPAALSVPTVIDARATTVQSLAVKSTTRDAKGDYPYRYSIVRTVVGQRPVTAYATATARILDVTPDGRGGAWWSERAFAASAGVAVDQDSLGHIDATGAARIVARNVAASTSGRDSLSLAPDPHDGSLWWQVRDASTWKRTTPGATTGALAYVGPPPIFGGGAGYAAGDDDKVVNRITGSGPGPAILGSASGRQLYLPSAVAARVKAADFSPDGLASVSSQGRYLLYQSGYLARVEASGQVRILSGPADGLPANRNASAVVVVGRQLMITMYSGKVYTVDVS